MKSNFKYLLGYLWIFFVCLFVIFFIGKEKDQDTKQNYFAVKLDAIRDFRMWMDIAW